MMDIQFWTTLIKVTRASTPEAKASLAANCTPVIGPYWIMEGDVDSLRADGVRCREVAEGAVGALGDLTQNELVEVCLQSYGVQLASAPDWKPDVKTIEWVRKELLKAVRKQDPGGPAAMASSVPAWLRTLEARVRADG
jgi:hypothetical protein